MSDRRVHGITHNGADVVRYDRAGKWYCEPPNGGARTAVSVTEAARLALTGVVYLGKPGGRAFDRKVGELRVGSKHPGSRS